METEASPELVQHVLLVRCASSWELADRHLKTEMQTVRCVSGVMQVELHSSCHARELHFRCDAGVSCISLSGVMQVELHFRCDARVSCISLSGVMQVELHFSCDAGVSCNSISRVMQARVAFQV